MKTAEFTAALKKLGLSVVGAGPALGISRRQSQRIAAGVALVPKPVAKLLRIAVERGIDLAEVRE
jgi:hypothetical protein